MKTLDLPITAQHEACLLHLIFQALLVGIIKATTNDLDLVLNLAVGGGTEGHIPPWDLK